MSELFDIAFGGKAHEHEETWQWHINYLNVANGYKYIFTRLSEGSFSSSFFFCFPSPPLEEIEIFEAKENIVQCDIRPERCGQSDAAEWKWNKIWGWVKHSLSLSGAPFNLLWDDLAHLLVWPETIAHAVKRKKSFRAFPFALKTLFTSSYEARF